MDNHGIHCDVLWEDNPKKGVVSAPRGLVREPKVSSCK